MKTALKLIFSSIVTVLFSCHSENKQASRRLSMLAPPPMRAQSPTLQFDPNEGYFRVYRATPADAPEVYRWFSTIGFSIDGEDNEIQGFDGKGGRFSVQESNGDLILTVWYFVDK